MRYNETMKHFLQSDAWANFQKAFGRTVISDEGSGWSYQAILEVGKFNTRLYAPYGPVINDKNALVDATQSLLDHARRLGVTFIRIEPTGGVDLDELGRLGYRKVAHVQPEVTSVVSLAPSADDIIAAMSANNRNLHRTYKQKGLSIHQSHSPQNMTVLIALLHGVARHTGLRNHPDTYFQKQADVLLPTKDAALYNVTFEDKPIVAAFVYDDAETRYYAHAAAGYAHRHLNAGNVLVSTMIIDAKKRGLKYFDLNGIWPQAHEKTSHAGITRFKHSFGGKDIYYAGTWELPVKPYVYAAYSIMTKVVKRLK